ncbi:hypothetical protein [Halalkalibacter oceani]|uniref:hypothetical protein n=1 Tax=Halalkalibacter oceani TaxID=1653776 RepID=UPI0033976656
MKNHKIPLGTKVRINDKAASFMKNDVGQVGIVVELLSNRLYDYFVVFDDGFRNGGKFKEEELDIIELPKGADSN